MRKIRTLFREILNLIDTFLWYNSDSNSYQGKTGFKIKNMY